MSDKFKPVGLIAVWQWILSHFKDETKLIDTIVNPPLNEVPGPQPYQVPNKRLQHKVQSKVGKHRRADRHH